MSHPGISIGQLASQTNTNVPTIRYCEDIGLLPDAQRAADGHRYYVIADVTRLGFIKRCRDFGSRSSRYAKWFGCSAMATALASRFEI